MRARTQPGWTKWCSQHQLPGPGWSTRSPITRPGKPNQPDDPRLKDYWAKRQAAIARDLTSSKQKLAKRQQGRCPQCGGSLFNDEELEVHHLLAETLESKKGYNNLVLIHLICHHTLHAQTKRGMSDCRVSNDRNRLAETKPLQ